MFPIPCILMHKYLFSCSTLFAYKLMIILFLLKSFFLLFSSFPLFLLSLNHKHEISITRYAREQAIALYDMSNDAIILISYHYGAQVFAKPGNTRIASLNRYEGIRKDGGAIKM